MVTTRPLAALLVLLVAAGCSVHPPVPDRSRSSHPSETPPTILATPTVAPTPDVPPSVEPLPVAVPAELLPPLATDFDEVTRVCDAFAFPLDADPLMCPNMIELGLRASGDVQPTVWRAEWEYGACGLGRCPDAGTVALHSHSAGTLLIDVHRTETGTVFLSAPRSGPPPAPAPSFESPPVRAPALPPGIENREPLPYCGRFWTHDDAAVEPACFLQSIDAGWPAELIEDVVSIEGAAGIHVYRFLGAGAVQLWTWWEPDQHGGDGLWHPMICAVYRRAADPYAFGCG